jgi:hypothetical protein
MCRLRCWSVAIGCTSVVRNGEFGDKRGGAGKRGGNTQVVSVIKLFHVVISYLLQSASMSGIKKWNLNVILPLFNSLLLIIRRSGNLEFNRSHLSYLSQILPMNKTLTVLE